MLRCVRYVMLYQAMLRYVTSLYVALRYITSHYVTLYFAVLNRLILIFRNPEARVMLYTSQLYCIPFNKWIF